MWRPLAAAPTKEGGALKRAAPFLGSHSTGAAADAAGVAAVAAAGGVDGVSNYHFYKDFSRWVAF